MQYILEDFISDEVDKNRKKELVVKFLNFTSKYKLSDIIQNGNICIGMSLAEEYNEILYLCESIYKFIDKEKFLKGLIDLGEDNEAIFWRDILDQIEYFGYVQRETAFLKEMNIESFEDLIKNVFDKYVLYNGLVKGYKNWNKDEIVSTCKTINTVLNSMITKFQDFDTSYFLLNIKFKFSENKFRFIWNLCEENKTYLIMKNITEGLDYIYNKLMKESE